MSGDPRLGKSANWPRKFARRGACLEKGQVAETEEGRLFNKNIANRKSVRMGTVGESCPVAACQAELQLCEAPQNGGGNYNPLKVTKCLAAELAACMNGSTSLPLSQPGSR